MHPVEALADNYMYLIVDRHSMAAMAVDPVEAGACVEAAARLGASIQYVLTTHHHFDHAGGNEEMKRLVPGLVVVGFDRDWNPGSADLLRTSPATCAADRLIPRSRCFVGQFG